MREMSRVSLCDMNVDGGTICITAGKKCFPLCEGHDFSFSCVELWISLRRLSADDQLSVECVYWKLRM